MTAAVQAIHARSAAAATNYKVYVGYADDLRPSPANFPTPWAGASNVIFEGCPGGSASCTNGGIDGGVVGVINTSSSTLTVGSVVITYDSSCVYDIWPHNVSLPAGDELIVSENEGGGPFGCTVSTGQMDGSDIGPGSQNWAGNCSQSGLVPKVAVTVNGAKSTYTDKAQVLNTGGVDANSCGHPNESEQWTPIGGKICYGLTLVGAPLYQHVAPGASATVKATLKNGCGQALPDEEVTFEVGSGPHASASQTVVTNSSGVASYTDSGTGAQGLDTITASVSNLAGTVTSNPAYVGFENAALTVSPASGTSATKVSASGSAFGNGEQVDLYWGSSSGPLLATATADSSGGFTAKFSPPKTATAGTYGVIAIGHSSGNQGIAVFTVAAPYAASIGIVTGTVYNTTTTAGFQPSGSALWSQPFASLAFNPDTNAPVSCSNSTGVNQNTRPFTNVTPVVDGTCRAVVVQNSGGTSQAGSGSLTEYDMVLTGTMSVPVAGNVSFNGVSDDGFTLGFGTSLGNQPTYVSGSHNSANLSSTWANGYPIAGADSGSHFPENAPFVVNFPAAGTYPYEIDYQEDGTAALQMVLQVGGVGGKALVATPTASLRGSSIAAGGEVSFKGAGFAPGETVNAYLDSSTGSVIGTATASSNGSISGNVTIPSGTSLGKHEVVFVGLVTGASAERAITVS